MAILDSKGRLFGKISLLDLGAALVILMVLGGIFLFPGTTGSSVAQVGVETKPVQVDLLVRGLTVADPAALIAQFKQDGKTDIIIRNQPYGTVDILSVEESPRMITAPQPDGTIKAVEDPRPESKYSINVLMKLGGEAQINKGEVVLGNSKVKIGTTLELEGPTYNFKGGVIGIKIGE
ncbi:MAG: DUF4330 domain-containing protein [Synechococcales cyanobacterium RM1_1_8]|nr:DUF4330 domain-containing protein [Synechococcales cyanobacterium RM1_1_8]